MTRAAQTALFLAIAVGGGWLVGALWVARPEWGWLSQFLMWTPGVAALVVLALRREPPRTLGFEYTGAGPWVAAYLYPFAVIGACIALAYAIRAVTGTDVIHLSDQMPKMEMFGVEASGVTLAALRIVRTLLVMLPWLVLALAYRHRLPERLGPAHHAVRVGLWAAVFWFNPGPWWLPPGNIGEELGWRGWLVRVWRDRPLIALALSAAAWAAFHAPVVVLMEPLHSFVPAASFLLSIAAAAAALQALYLWSGSVWPPIIAHFAWNAWNPYILGNQYGGGPSVFGGEVWLINGEGLLGLVVNLAITAVLIARWRRDQI